MLRRNRVIAKEGKAESGENSLLECLEEAACCCTRWPGPDSPEAFGAFIRSESEKWGKVVRAAKIATDEP